MTILDVRWFCGAGNVGVVRVNDPYDGIKYYICDCSGYDEKNDMEHIAKWGNTFPTEAGVVLFGLAYSTPTGSIPLPRSIDEARAMNLLSEHYINNHT